MIAHDGTEVYYEYLDEDGKWYLGKMEYAKAIICQLVMGEDFRFVDESKIIFE